MTHRVAVTFQRIFVALMLPIAFLLVEWPHLAAEQTFSANQWVEIGQFTPTGTVALQLSKFQEQFADGTGITEITIAEYRWSRMR